MASLIPPQQAGVPCLHKWATTLEASFLLISCQAALRLLPFKRLAPLFNRRVLGIEITGAARIAVCEEVRAAIEAATARLPLRPVCFPRAMAAQIMLRRREVSSDLYYGAAVIPNRGLSAHVWLMDGITGIVGHREAGTFKILARYSSRSGFQSEPSSDDPMLVSTNKVF